MSKPKEEPRTLTIDSAGAGNTCPSYNTPVKKPKQKRCPTCWDQGTTGPSGCPDCGKTAS